MFPVYAHRSSTIPQTASQGLMGLANALEDAAGPSGRGREAGTACPLWTAPTAPKAPNALV